MTQDNSEVDTRLGVLFGQVIDAGDTLDEEIAFKAIRAAYMRGYLDGEKARADEDAKA